MGLIEQACQPPSGGHFNRRFAMTQTKVGSSRLQGSEDAEMALAVVRVSAVVAAVLIVVAVVLIAAL